MFDQANELIELVIYHLQSMRGDNDFRKEIERLFKLGVPIVEEKKASSGARSGWFEHGDNMVVRRPSGRSESQVRALVEDASHAALVVENRYEEYVLRTAAQEVEVELVEEITGRVVRLNMANMGSTVGVLKRIK